MILAKKTKLTKQQLSLLNRGLNFIPTTKNNSNLKPQSRLDLQNYHRRLKLWAFYGDSEVTQKQPFTPPSGWSPPDLQLPAYVRDLIQSDLTYFQNSFHVIGTHPNLTSGEKNALRELINNPEIVIKPADKGSVVVVMDRDQYLWEGHKQLEDKKYYLKLNKPIFMETLTEITEIFQRIYNKKLINAKQRNYLIGDTEPRARRFYMLPKIHKDPSKWRKPFEIPPGRPIVSDCNSETYRSAEYIDYFLNPLAKLHKSYIKDTYDFIDKIKNLIIPDNAILFTIDVDSLYTNIDTSEGIQAVKKMLQNNYVKKRPDKELIQLLEINLTKNDFEFNGNYYLQIKGTAMGKKFAPAYADIFMAAWETTALAKCSKKPLQYFRYLDDIWGVWTHSLDDFNQFLDTLNNHNPSIKLKATTDQNSVDFLDTTTFKGPSFSTTNKLDIKVFFKETDTHALLHKSSFHPKHTFAGLIKSQLLRFHRICTQKEDFLASTKVLFRSLSSRGYSRSFLRQCFKTYLQSKPISVTSALPFVTTYSPSSVLLVKNIKNNLEKIITTHKLKLNIKIIAAFRKNKNLNDHLVRAKLKPQEISKPKLNTQYFKQIRYVYDSSLQKVFSTATQGNVHTKNCVYLITCKQCNVKYVGETSLAIHVRFTCHKYNIVRQKHTDRHVVAHFVSHGWDSVQASILQCNPHWSTQQRRRSERDWINKLGTTYPQGLNERIYFRA